MPIPYSNISSTNILISQKRRTSLSVDIIKDQTERASLSNYVNIALNDRSGFFPFPP